MGVKDCEFCPERRTRELDFLAVQKSLKRNAVASGFRRAFVRIVSSRVLVSRALTYRHHLPIIYNI